jgi:hypothetical protein
MTHDTAHEELLQQMLAGDFPPDSDRARTLMEGCAECAQQWREMQSLVESIGLADRERREVLAEAARERSTPGSDRVQATLEAERRKTFGDSKPARSGVPLTRALLLAAALLVAGFFVVRALVPAKPVAHDTPLGIKIRFEHDYETLSPGVPIQWRFGGGADRVFFHVRMRGTDEHGDARSEDIRVQDTEWTPDAEHLSGWKGSVRMWIEAFDRVAGESLGTSPVISLTVSR